MADKKLFFDNIAHTDSVEREKAMHRVLLESMIKSENPDISSENLDLEIAKHRSAIALMESNKINNVLLRDTSTVIKNFEKNYKTKGSIGNTDSVVDAYKNVSKDFFGYMAKIDSWTSKENTPREFMSKVISLNQNIDTINYNYSPVKMHTDFNSTRQAYGNLKKAKSFYTIDLETLGGPNASGFKQLDTVTEFAIQQFDQSGKVIANGGHSNLIGLSEDQAASYLRELSDAKEGGIKTGRMNVLLNRFSKYGHGDTVLNHVGGGQYDISQFAGEAAEGLNSYEAAERGVKQLAEVGRVQRANRLPDGKMLWEKQWVDGLEAMKNNVTVGYNTVYADMPWINQFNATGLPKASQEELKRRIGSNFLQLDPAKHFDFYVAANAASQLEGKSKLYNNNGQLSSVLKEHGLSPLQQEGLGRQYAPHLYEESAAHTAKLDSRVLAYLSTEAKSGNKSLVDSIMADAEAAASSISGQVTGGKRQLFMADKSVSMNSFTNENALTFVEDKFSKTIRTVGGYEIDPETGSARKELVKQFPVKRNMTYTVDWIKQFNTNDEWLKQIGSVHPEYAQESVFGIKMSSVVDHGVKGADMHTAIDNNLYRFFTSLDELQGFVSSTFMQIGERADAEGDWQELGGKAGAEVKKHLTTHTITEDGLKEIPHDGNLISNAVTSSTKKGINDSAARMIREDGYKHAVKFNDLLTEVTKQATASGVSTPMNYENARPVLAEMLKQSQMIARKVSENIPLTQEEQGTNTLHKILGFSDRATGEQRLFSETYNKFIGAYDHLYGANPVFQAVNESIGKFAGKDASPEYRQYLHEQTLQHLRNEAMAQHDNAGPLALGNKPATIYEKDLNFFELDLDGFAKKKGVMPLGELVPGRSDNLLRINLGANGQHNLVSSLLGKNYSNPKSISKKPESLKQLALFAEHVKENYSGFNIAAEKNDTVQTLGEKIINGLKGLRKINPQAGIVSDAMLHDVSEEALVYKNFINNPEATKKTADSFLRQLPKFRSFKAMSGKEDIKVQAQEIVDSMLMPNKNVLKNLNQYGYNKQQISTLERLYGIARKDQISGMENLLHGISQSDADLIYDAKSGMMGAIHNGKTVTLDSIPKVKFENGQFFVESGRSRVSLHAVLSADMKGIERNKTIRENSVRMISTVGEAWEQNNHAVSSFARKDQAGVLGNIEQYVKNLAGRVREGSAIEDMGSIHDVQKQLQVDFKALVGLVPHLGIEWIALRDDKETFKKAFLGKRKRPISWNNLNSHQREILAKNIAGFRDKLVGGKLVKGKLVGKRVDDDVAWFMENLSLTNKETNVVEYTGMVGMHEASGLSQFNNNQRPVDSQTTRAVRYRASEIQERLNTIGKRSQTALGGRVSLDSKFHTSLTASRYTSAVEGINGKTNITSRVGKLSVSDLGYKVLVADWYKKLDPSEKTGRMDKVINRLKSGNLHDQEAIMDARIMDAAFSGSDHQRVDATRQLFEEHLNNLQTWEQLKENNKLVPEMKIVDGEITFTYKKGKFVKYGDHFLSTVGFGDTEKLFGSKKGKGVANFGFFSRGGGGILATAEEVQQTFNAHIRKNGINLKADDHKKVFETMRNLYDMSFYVESVTAHDFKKIGEGMGEKGMTQGMYMGMGELSGKVGNALNHMGLGGFKGDVLSYKHAVELTDADNIHNTIFGDIGGLNKTKYEKAVQKAGFKNADEFAEALWTERYEASRTLMDRVLGENNGGKVGFIANHMLESHKNRMLPMEEVINSAVEKHKAGGLSEEEASKKVYDEISPAFHSENGLQFKDGKFIVENMDVNKGEHIDSDVLRKFAHNNGLEYEHIDQAGVKHAIAGERFQAGNVVGNISTAVLSEVRDFGEITSSGEALTKAEIRAGGRGAQIQKSLERGMKVTTRELGLLDLQKYDNPFVESLANNVSKSEFSETVGHVLEQNEDGSYKMKDGKHVIQQKYINRSVLQGHTDSIRDNLFFKPGETTMSDSTVAKSLERMNPLAAEDFSSYTAVVKENAKATGQKVSMESAEKLYALKKGFRAQRWNNGKLGDDIGALAGEGYNKIKIGEAVKASGGDVDYLLKSGDSIFSGNTVLDLSVGVHGAENVVSGSNRYLALPMLPRMTNGDEIIKWKSQEAVHSLIGSHQRLLDAYHNVPDHLGDVPDIQKAKANYLQKIEDVKGALGTDLTGKAGVFTDMASYRMDGAVMGKASGVVTYAKSRMGDVGKDLIGNLTDAEINPGFLSKAKIDGKSVLEHFQEGKGYDVEGLSEDMFERLGFFDNKSMAKHGIDSSASDARDQMKALLEEKGTMMFSQRYPSIKEGTQRPVHAFLNNTAKHNRVSVSAEGWLSSGGDFDGDLSPNALAKYKYTDAGGRTQQMDYLEYMLRKESGQTVDANVESIFKDNKAFMVQRASVVNKYYTDKVYSKALEDIDKAVTNNDAFTISGSASLDNKIFGELGHLGKADAADEHFRTYEELQKKVFAMHGKSEDDRENLNNVNKYINELDDRRQADKYYKSAAFSEMFGKQEMSAMAKFRKLTIGEVNLPLFSLRKIADVGLDRAAEDTPMRQHVVQHFADAIEQEVISSKKADDIRYTVDKAEQFKGALNSALGRSGQEKDSSKLRGWINQHLNLNKKLEPEAHLKTTYGFENGQQMVDTFISTIDGLDGPGLHDLEQFERLGQQQAGMSHKYLQDALVYAEHGNTAEDGIMRMLGQTSPEIGIRALSRDDVASNTSSTVMRAVEEATQAVKNAPRKAVSDTEQLLNTVRSKMASAHITGKGLAFGALGLAGATMVAGFVGGNPSKPAETHAQDESDSEYQIPQLTDTNLNKARGGPQQGYVININAQTSQGQQHASSAIQQALASGFGNTNINVAMNVHNSGQVNASQVSKLLESAFQ